LKWSSILEIDEISESGGIGAPDEMLFEKVVAFVNPHSGKEWSSELELMVRLHGSNRVSYIATPQEIIVIDRMLKNKSGKLMRRVLKANYLNTDADDTSIMEI